MDTTVEANTPQQEAGPVKGGIVAYLQVDGAMKAADFYKRALGATFAGAHPPDDQGRTMHVHLYINGGSLMLCDPYPDYGIRSKNRRPSRSCCRSRASTPGGSVPWTPVWRW